jgi:hypothetical protein
VVELSSRPHVVDVVASFGALVPEDPISHGVLNGLLKDNGSWAPLIQHWKMARSGLRRLAILAQTSGSSQIVLRRLDELNVSPGQPSRINSLDIGELNAVSRDSHGPRGDGTPIYRTAAGSDRTGDDNKPALRRTGCDGPNR